MSQTQTEDCGVCPPCLEAKRRGFTIFERQLTYSTAESLLCNAISKRISSRLQAKSSILEDRLTRLRRILAGHEAVCLTTGELKERVQAAGSSEENVFVSVEGKRISYCIICVNEISVCSCRGGYYGDVALEYASLNGEIKDQEEK